MNAYDNKEAESFLNIRLVFPYTSKTYATLTFSAIFGFSFGAQMHYSKSHAWQQGETTCLFKHFTEQTQSLLVMFSGTSVSGALS